MSSYNISSESKPSTQHISVNSLAPFWNNYEQNMVNPRLNTLTALFKANKLEIETHKKNLYKTIIAKKIYVDELNKEMKTLENN